MKVNLLGLMLLLTLLGCSLTPNTGEVISESNRDLDIRTYLDSLKENGDIIIDNEGNVTFKSKENENEYNEKLNFLFENNKTVEGENKRGMTKLSFDAAGLASKRHFFTKYHHTWIIGYFVYSSYNPGKYSSIILFEPVIKTKTGEGRIRHTLGLWGVKVGIDRGGKRCYYEKGHWDFGKGRYVWSKRYKIKQY